MVVIIESESALQTLLAANLTARGYTAVALPDRAKACDCLSNAKPRALIVDIHFEDTNVWTFLDHLCGDKDVPVIVTTTFPEVLKRAAAHPNVRAAFLKPYSVKEIVTVVTNPGYTH